MAHLLFNNYLKYLLKPNGVLNYMVKTIRLYLYATI